MKQLPKPPPPRDVRLITSTSELTKSHKNHYQDSHCVVACWPDDPGGHPYADQKAPGVAAAFAASKNATVVDYGLSHEFRLSTDDSRWYRVVADRHCQDVVIEGMTARQRLNFDALVAANSAKEKELRERGLIT